MYVPAAGEASDVELMPAGDVTDGVVRVGGTIRRPHQQPVAWPAAGTVAGCIALADGA